MELRDGQSERVDRLELREDVCLVADLLGIQIVGNTQHPMFCPGLT